MSVTFYNYNFFLFIRMAEKYGMKLIKRLSFADYFKENIEKGEARSLISRMQALEVGKSCI